MQINRRAIFNFLVRRYLDLTVRPMRRNEIMAMVVKSNCGNYLGCMENRLR